jgi:hypothetical protein
VVAARPAVAHATEGEVRVRQLHVFSKFWCTVRNRLDTAKPTSMFFRILG